MTYQDQTLTCRDCGKPFVFTIRDQEFFAEKGFTNPPTRCRDCRNLRKKEGGAPRPAAVAQADKTLYKITCKTCGKGGEMAIEPRKPDDVLCSECFYEAFKKELAKKEAAGPLAHPADEPKSKE